MPRKRILTGEFLEDIFEKTGPGSRRPSPYDTKFGRHTYRIRDSSHGELKAVAEENGVSLNDLVRFFIEKFLREYHSGELTLPIEEYVVTKSRLTE